jgi:DNA-binding phage protein
MANNSISLVNLDFDTLKSTLKTYLKGQAQFADYDFDGSNMSVLLDILTYNTHLNAFYMNMAVSEMFLDSAQLRNSVISKSKELNYVPRSARSSKATINISFPQSNLSVFQIPFGTRFTGKSGNGTFTFTTDQSYILYPSGDRFTSNVDIYDGNYITDTFVIDTSIENQRFIMSNDNIDTKSLIIIVSQDNGQTNALYTQATNLYGLTSTSNVYFIQATEDTKYELVFGDKINRIFGNYPLNGSIVYSTYRICSGGIADNSTNFTLDDNLGPINGIGSASPTINVIATATGGFTAEDIESIRFNAPRHYQTQDRAVTSNDFKNLVLMNYRDVKTVNVYGGETIKNKVEYGKVYISAVTHSGAPLSNYEKQDIETFLSDKCTMGVVPRMIDPDYLYLIVTSNIKFNPNSTVNSPADIKNYVTNAIANYNKDYLTKFDTVFKLSRLETAINDSDKSISSNQTSVILRKDVNPQLNTDTYIDINFQNQIAVASFVSSVFLSNGKQYQYTDFNPLNNTISIIQSSGGHINVSNSSKNVYLKDVSKPGYETYLIAGVIDYQSGMINLNKISINGFVNSSSIQFYASPSEQDIKTKNNDLIQIDLKKLTIKVTSN